MSSLCTDPISCVNGNCVGCKNGKPWCQDPQCSPFCSNCPTPQQHDFNANFVMGVIISALLAILFIIWFVYGPQLVESHSDYERANVIMPQQMRNTSVKTS